MSVEEVPNLTSVVADIGATNVRVTLSRGPALGPIRQRRLAELQGGEDDSVANGLVGLIRDAIAAGFDGEPAQVAAAGIGVCATVDDGGSLQPPLPSGVPGGRRIADIVGAALGVPVAVDNDANMAALGELRHGAGRGLRDFVLITLGTNIGMGLVAGGRVLRGAHGGAGEGGMMLVPARSPARLANELGRRLVDVGQFGAHPSRAPEGYAWVEELVGGGALARALPNVGALQGPRVHDPRLRCVSSPRRRPGIATPRASSIAPLRDGPTSSPTRSPSSILQRSSCREGLRRNSTPSSTGCGGGPLS